MILALNWIFYLGFSYTLKQKTDNLEYWRRLDWTGWFDGKLNHFYLLFLWDRNMGGNSWVWEQFGWYSLLKEGDKLSVSPSSLITKSATRCHCLIQKGGLSKLKLHHSFDHLVLLYKIGIVELGRGDSASNLTILAQWTL